MKRRRLSVVEAEANGLNLRPGDEVCGIDKSFLNGCLGKVRYPSHGRL